MPGVIGIKLFRFLIALYALHLDGYVGPLVNSTGGGEFYEKN
jgi:hypothetical protein